MKVAITGASGQLGSSVLLELLRRDYALKALVRKDTRSLEGLPVEKIKGDLLDPASLVALLKDCETLIHCAAIVPVHGDTAQKVAAVNVDGTRQLMQISRDAGIRRVVHISSVQVYQQEPVLEMMDETRGPVQDKTFIYHCSKRKGEETALSFHQPGSMEVIVMQPTAVMGPYDYKPSKMGKALMDLYRGKLPFIFDGGFDFCDARDLAVAIVNALTMGRPGEKYLLGGQWYPLKELAQIMSTVTGKKIKPYILPYMLGRTGLPFIQLLGTLQKKDPLYTREVLAALFGGNRCISSKKAMQELDYRTRPLEETLSDTLQWFRQMGYLD